MFYMCTSTHEVYTIRTLIPSDYFFIEITLSIGIFVYLQMCV